jgi:zinc/manganese transport system ATP-binding protein
MGSSRECVVTAALRFKDLTLGYDRHPAVHHLNGTVQGGSLLALVGPNGAGKSTLLKGIVGLLPPLAGSIEHGLKPSEVAYLPQIAEIDRSFPISVYDLVAMGLWRNAGLMGRIGRGERATVGKALATVGLEGFEQRPIGTLSGGQMQRALFARLLLQDARLILLDEPFAALDSGTVTDLLEIVRRWHAEQRTVIAVLHDFETVRQRFPEALLLARSPVAWGPTSEVLKPDNLLKARHMCEAFHDDAQVCEVHTEHAA